MMFARRRGKAMALPLLRDEPLPLPRAYNHTTGIAFTSGCSSYRLSFR